MNPTCVNVFADFALRFVMGDDPVFCADCVCDDSVRKIVPNSIADFNLLLKNCHFAGLP